MNIKSPQVFSIGPRPVVQRRLHEWLQKATVGALFSLSVFSASAHEVSPNVSLASPAVHTASQNAPILIPVAQFAPTVFEEKARACDLDWVTESRIDGHKLLNQWEQGGVTAQQAIELINVLMLTQSPIVATTQQALDFATEQSQATKNIFDIKNERNAMFFLRTSDTVELTKNNVLSEVQLMTLAEIDDPSWQDVYAYWDKFSSDRLDDPILQNNNGNTAQEFNAARTQLLNAVQNAGLASLRVPLSVWDSPQRITRLAERIDQANGQLQQLTGWSGKVLGMNHALHLEIMKPGTSCVTYQTAQSNINITSSWEDLAHEWLHGMQAVIAQRSIGSEALTKTFSTQQGQQPQLEQQWGNVLNQIINHPSSAAWQKNLNAYLDGSETVVPSRPIHWDDMQTARAYYTSASETMAYAWGSYVQSQLPMNSALSPQSQNYNVADGVIAPTSVQASVQKQTWETAFQQLDVSFSSASVVPPSATFAQKVAARRQVAQNTGSVPRITPLKNDY